MLNSSVSQIETFTLTTEPKGEDIEIETTVDIPPLHRTQALPSNGDGNIANASRSLGAQKSEELQKTLLAHRHERHLVILQDFPDPDALSSAWAYQLIAQQYDIKCEIIYAGTLSHQENIALVKLTALPAQRCTAQSIKTKDLVSYQGFVLIDNQGTTSALTSALQQAGIPLITLVDHHSLQGELKAEFTDVRPYVRATATIFTQYLQSGLLTLDSSMGQHVKCATALMHGLRSDTNRLMQAQEEDFMAAAYLSKFYDAQLLNAILQANRSKRVMDVIERSLKNRIVQNNFSIAGVGYLRYDDRDAIPQAADFLVTEENVHTAMVYGIVHDEDDELEVVIGSLRTTKLTLDPDEFIKEAFGQDSTGRFFGGGRTGAGGFEIPMGFLSGGNENSAYAKIKWEVFDAQIKQKLLKLVNPKDNPI
ncbi:bifunctional oligoribonuclease/PAP phosphatase NrnA [Cylindrospermopsis raciborskii S07]|jgi:nanoRNase/pAp phosphatase (c-di-AMP/oligoRNAs hydrolase)|uniref:Exopolyphosphatase-like protein n=3 Tax=Cylindrospermopsis raciborskii TaxID=77022 RepID=A0A853MDM5_9CYAN|nr:MULTISPECIES: bifunctional oligoribonuclease/PAP phosphatase NrnA [Cylindrospermopsis]MBU6343763.1 bifunctional oligoribonuclease/PAP phosphatase NrnA [Cyanobacteria bacterium REEB494]EFA68444.1 Phosphoesterase, RecJ-like protein [Cylindrospermopsis raciborskii CS-505]KRH96141.1 exopolyphosphatase-like protein [Cylindrospermopsis sp. CR12]MBA4445855.1 bifunctional oligoribonuclease/PAP phosphatase NrnA [Cylindrospermopsis raciborskii CS-506_C]MBA4456703.1 bifunctional oligoribonuclease/PAP 